MYNFFQSKLYNYFWLNLFGIVCILLLSQPFTKTLVAQDKNSSTVSRSAERDRVLSVGYSSRTFEYNYNPFEGYDSELTTLRKGYLEVDYEEYLTQYFYLNFSANYLFFNEGLSVLGGPINFKEAGADFSLGFRYWYLSFYGGLQGRYQWDYEVKGQDSEGTEFISLSSSVDNKIFAPIVGLKLYVLEFFTIKTEIAYDVYHQSVIYATPSGGNVPAFESLKLEPGSVRVTLSLSEPGL